MKKIAIVVFHFGKAPWYLNFFLKSCRANHSIDFLFFTDLQLSDQSAPNIQFIPFSLEEFNRLATKRLGLNIAAQKAYKLCDMRPAFGAIFRNWLKPYDFWGYADTDIILGQIRNFFTDDILENYDVIWPKLKYPPGYFTLYRNKDDVNLLYIKAIGYKEVFQSPLNHMFDECGGAYLELESGANILDTGLRFESIHHALEKEKARIKSYRMQCVSEGTPGEMRWENGVLKKQGKEVLLYHMSDYKSNFFTRKKNWKPVSDIFFIDKHNIRRPSFFGHLILLWTERINPVLIRLRYMLLALLSVILKKRARHLSTGKYAYMSMQYIITSNGKQENFLKTDQGEAPFLSVPFLPNHVFLPKYRLLLQKEDSKLRLFMADGNTLLFSPSSEIPVLR